MPTRQRHSHYAVVRRLRSSHKLSAGDVRVAYRRACRRLLRWEQRMHQSRNGGFARSGRGADRPPAIDQRPRGRCPVAGPGPQIGQRSPSQPTGPWGGPQARCPLRHWQHPPVASPHPGEGILLLFSLRPLFFSGHRNRRGRPSWHLRRVATMLRVPGLRIIQVIRTANTPPGALALSTAAVAAGCYCA